MQEGHSEMDVPSHQAPTGLLAIGIFLFFGATMASLAATTLLWPGTALDRLWVLNPKAHEQLVPLGSTVGILFLVLGAALTAAGIGWFRRRLWGWRLAAGIIAVQVVGDVVNCVRGDWLRGGTGVIIAGALLLFLLSQKIRAAFG
jgi:sterol desaturase/sphingolipid hydroxylase (fatty acid hydroxylase superfamily)